MLRRFSVIDSQIGERVDTVDTLPSPFTSSMRLSTEPELATNSDEPATSKKAGQWGALRTAAQLSMGRPKPIRERPKPISDTGYLSKGAQKPRTPKPRTPGKTRTPGITGKPRTAGKPREASPRRLSLPVRATSPVDPAAPPPTPLGEHTRVNRMFVALKVDSKPTKAQHTRQAAHARHATLARQIQDSQHMPNDPTRAATAVGPRRSARHRSVPNATDANKGSAGEPSTPRGVPSAASPRRRRHTQITYTHFMQTDMMDRVKNRSRAVGCDARVTPYGSDAPATSLGYSDAALMMRNL